MSHRFDFDRLRDYPLYQPGTTRPDPNFSTGRWAEPIDRLLAARYPFHACRFSDEGYLFRGLAGGLASALRDGCFGDSGSTHRMSEVERIMGVYFVTTEFSDALTLAPLYDDPADAGILIFRSGVFNRRLDAYAAAVLAIGDSGVVFRYPFLAEPLTLSDIDYLLVSPATRAMLGPESDRLGDRLLVIPPGDRAGTERWIAACFRGHGVVPATPVPGGPYPRRR